LGDGTHSGPTGPLAIPSTPPFSGSRA
jgi:hypothetical protein